MPRIRTIKPEFFTSLTLASLPVEARLTFIGLWTHCDDAGRCRDEARLIKAAVWPLDDRTAEDIEKDLGMLSEVSLIIRYEVAGRRFLAVRTWREHQKINRPTDSKIPGPDQANVPPPTSGNRTTSGAHEQLSEDALSGHDRKGKEQGTGKGTGKPPSAARAGVHASDPDRPQAADARAGTVTPFRRRNDIEPPTDDGTREIAEAGPGEQIVSSWLSRRPKPPPTDIRERFGRAIAGFIADGVDPAHIEAGVRHWEARPDLGVGALSSLVYEAQNQPAALAGAPRPANHGAATAKAVGWLELGEQEAQHIEQHANGWDLPALPGGTS